MLGGKAETNGHGDEEEAEEEAGAEEAGVTFGARLRAQEKGEAEEEEEAEKLQQQKGGCLECCEEESC